MDDATSKVRQAALNKMSEEQAALRKIEDDTCEKKPLLTSYYIRQEIMSLTEQWAFIDACRGPSILANVAGVVADA